MSGISGLRSQIILSLGLMALGIILFVVVGSYGFYAVAMVYSPASISETWMPSRMEWVWMVVTALVALIMAVCVAIRLSRRILNPMNAVAQSLRELAQGNLMARVTQDKLALGETAQLMRDFNSMAERLQSLAQDQMFWNAAVAHELRTPVTILRGRLQGLTEGVFPPNPDMFEVLLRQVESLSQLIEDLRVLSLTDSGHFELRLRRIDLAYEVSTVLQSFATNLAASGFTAHLESEIQESVICDPTRIRQGLLALLENALKHAEPGALNVHLWRDGGNYNLSVADSGPGIAPEFAAHVFEAFRRGDPSRSRKNGGSGLGLAVVKAIAEAHGGSVACQCSAAGGTLFTLTWPVRLSTTADA